MEGSDEGTSVRVLFNISSVCFCSNEALRATRQINQDYCQVKSKEIKKVCVCVCLPKVCVQTSHGCL